MQKEHFHKIKLLSWYKVKLAINQLKSNKEGPSLIEFFLIEIKKNVLLVVSRAVYHWSDAWCLPLSDSQQWLYLSVSVLHWEASILGPVSLWRCIFSDFNTSIVQQGNFLTCVDCWQEDSPYHGGRFWLRIDFTADYPFRPPKVQWQFLWYPVFQCLLTQSWSAAFDLHCTCEW